MSKGVRSSQAFVRRRETFEPAYLELYRSGEMEERIQRSHLELAECRVCPRDCGVDRLQDKRGACNNGRFARVASFHPHLGEEDCLRGWRGSGTIFFSGCNLRCVFCQNFDISQGGSPVALGSEVDAQELAAIMLFLQDRGCHNINFVTPEHVVPQIIEALLPAVQEGLHLPLVYNTSAYDSLSSLYFLDGLIDIYMPDFKIWESAHAHHYLKARDYPQVAREAFKEMHRQVGDLTVDENGLALRGLLVRHLVMPGSVAGTREIMRFLADELSMDTYVNLMDQYYPSGKVSSERYPEINRRLLGVEYAAALEAARDAGLWRFDQRRTFKERWPLDPL